jgi:hypothetical protein
MNRFGVLLAALVVFGAREVRAETWTTRIDLVPESSAPTCTEVPQIMWTLTLEAGTFSGMNNFGAKFSTPVGPDGAVTASYTGNAGGNETFEMVLSGNTKTRQLEIFNAKLSCRYKFTSK